MLVRRWGGRLGLCLLLVLIFVWGCRRERPTNFDRNLPPETVLTGVPPESTQTYYQVHLKWYGVDPDGLIDHFEFSVTDTNKTPGEDDPGFSGYFRTTKTDSVFRLDANDPQILGHRFYVRAVDNEGKTDPTPAWTYFVAADFNFPNIVFNSSVGRWIDRKGRERTLNLTSKSLIAPTDTIGVGGFFDATWSGFDVDIGGFVVGYEFRRTTDETDFLGGTLNDTTAFIDFAVPPGSDLTSYFSGNAAIIVRAIDDAGAKTNPESLRAVTVNFSPKTWIVDPNQTSPPVRAVPPVFLEKDTQTIYPTGTVLADGLRQIQFKYTGFDDERDISLDPNNPSGIVGFQFRRLKNGGGIAFTDISSWKQFPLVSDFDDGSGLTSGDYVYLIRSKDELGRNGRAETLRVSVNYYPYFDWVRYVDSDTVEQALWNPGSLPGTQADTVVITIPEQPGGGYDDLTIRFFARDDHDPLDQDPRDFNVLVEQELSQVTSYQTLLNGARQSFDLAPLDSMGVPLPDERSFAVSPLGGSGIVSPGLNALVLKVKDISGRVTELELIFRAELQ